jgi:hemerythrin superfamily protein
VRTYGIYVNMLMCYEVRFLRSAEFKERIRAFFTQFAKHRADLQNMLVPRVEARTFEQGFEMDRISRNTEKIIARLGEPTNEEEIKALRIINQYGRDRVIQVSYSMLYCRITFHNDASFSRTDLYWDNSLH